MSIHRSIGALVALACLALVCGCQSGGTPPPAPAMDPSKAVMVTVGNGGTIYYASTDGAVHSMGTADAKMCKQCESDAMAYFKTGHIDAVCSVCGAHRAAIFAASNTGHQ